jgi:AAA domain/Bifunctional DNA primase/polymerase, N-terminal
MTMAARPVRPQEARVALSPRDVGTYPAGTFMPAFSPADQVAALVGGTTPLDLALAHAAQGREVFPFRLRRVEGKYTKTPLVKWSTVATSDEDQIRKWAQTWPRAAWGWRLPVGTVVADVDDAQAFAATGLDLAPTAGQTTVSGGSHWLYSGLDARQTVKVIDGLDTRVGGKGWVGLYSIDAFSGEVAPAPDWLLDLGTKTDQESDGSPITTRHGICEVMGAWRRVGLGEKQILAELRERFEDGRIASSDSARPWLDADFITLAAEAAKWTPAEELPPVLPVFIRQRVAPAPGPEDQIDAADLMKKIIPPKRWVVPGFLPQGFGVLASAPKVGKTRLCLQIVVAARLPEEEVLDKKVETRDVLFYCLENDEESVQGAIEELLHGREMPRGLTLLWTAPRLQGGLEEEINDWLVRHPVGLVVIDMLAKVRPARSGKSSRTSYDEDYDALSPLHDIARAHPGCTILILTHDRKAGSDDWMSKITGSRGVTGVGDFAIFIDRKRNAKDGVIYIDGRYFRETDDIPVNFRDGWYSSGTLKVITQSPVRDKILTWLEANGPAEPREVARGLGMLRNTADRLLLALLESGQLSRDARGYAVMDANTRPTSIIIITDGDTGDAGDAGDGNSTVPQVNYPIIISDGDDDDACVPTSSHVRHIA